jgi:hypothetical protein
LYVKVPGVFTFKSDLERVSDTVRLSMEAELTKRQEDYVITVPSLTLIKTGLNTYDGLATMKLHKRGGKVTTLDVRINVTADKDNAMWKMDPMSVFAFTAAFVEGKK